MFFQASFQSQKNALKSRPVEIDKQLGSLYGKRGETMPRPRK